MMFPPWLPGPRESAEGSLLDEEQEHLKQSSNENKDLSKDGYALRNDLYASRLLKMLCWTSSGDAYIWLAF